MVRIPYIKIPSVRVGSIVPTSNIGTGGAAPAPPTPVTYLTQWKIVGNSEVHGNEIWSCGEYSAVDNKWHIRILPEGYGVVDIALDEPLRKVGDVADSIEFVNGVATLTRKIVSVKWNDCNVICQAERKYKRFLTSSITSTINKPTDFFKRVQMCLSSDFIQDNAPLQSSVETNPTDMCMAVYTDGTIYVRDTSTTNVEDFYEKYGTHEFLYRLATPITETIQVPQIQEADSYSCIISQGAKAVEWSSFETE